jgi:hypothetical protein
MNKNKKAHFNIKIFKILIHKEPQVVWLIPIIIFLIKIIINWVKFYRIKKKEDNLALVFRKLERNKLKAILWATHYKNNLIEKN